MIDAHLPRGSLEWLDVGVGNGASLTYLLRALSRERRFNVVAIDPQFSPAPHSFSGWPISFYQTKLEDLDLEGPYDCINMRQSCYYLDHPADSIVQLADTLSADGIVAITLWGPGLFFACTAPGNCRCCGLNAFACNGGRTAPRTTRKQVSRLGASAGDCGSRRRPHQARRRSGIRPRRTRRPDTRHRWDVPR
jgi:SAM-dependent methyltransferase